jgi:aminoglycoside/choline kinase family phosphotransferase
MIGPDGCRLPLPPYDDAVLAREAALVRQWWMPAAGAEPSADLAAEFDALVAESTVAVAPCRDVLVLRDYHAENLIWLPERIGAARVGLLDYQDALAGHAAYDLVSLLEDARRDTSPDLREAMIRRYLDRHPGLHGAAFRAAYAALGAQRNLKIVGIFARLAIRDGKPRYLSLIPRVWGHLQSDLAHPALAPLRDWVARHVPPPDPAALARAAAAAEAAR